jgi:catechol 2,3-dioxygenase-like lactoylglutathione lyase family enzyme
VKVQQLWHVMLKVRERERSERFYTEVLGLQIAARRDTPPMTFFTLGNHHDFAIVALGADTPDSPADSPGLYHVAFKTGTRSMIFAGPRRTSTRSASRSTRSRITRWRRASTSTTRTATRSRCTSIPPMSGVPTRRRLRASPRLPSSKASAETDPTRRSGEYQRCRASPSTRATRPAGKRRRPRSASAGRALANQALGRWRGGVGHQRACSRRRGH